MKLHTLVTVSLAVLVLASGANAQGRRHHHHYYNGQNNQNYGQDNQNYRSSSNYQNVLVPAGTTINVRLDNAISTDDAHQGDAWNGTVTQNVVTGNGIAIPAGSQVQGVVSSSAQGTHDTRAQLALGLRSITVNGQARTMSAEAEPIIAGTASAKKVGAIAVGAAAGALLGHTVARDNHGTLIGGLVGGAAGYGLSRNALRTLQLKSGTVLNFTTSENMLARR